GDPAVRLAGPVGDYLVQFAGGVHVPAVRVEPGEELALPGGVHGLVDQVGVERLDGVQHTRDGKGVRGHVPGESTLPFGGHVGQFPDHRAVHGAAAPRFRDGDGTQVQV